MFLEIKNISKTYGKKKVLDDLSVTMECGVYGLLGPNGAGKSTLIGIITGLVTADCGSVKYSDDLNRPLGEALGFLPQYQSFYKGFTAEEFLLYMAELKNYKHENPRKYVKKLLEEVNLGDSAQKKIGAFSGGMKQRLGIAQALIGNPGLIIFDEPTAGLDPKERIRFRNIVSTLGKDRIVILATHIVTDIAYIAKKVILINGGKLLYAASQKEITQSINGKVWQFSAEGDKVQDIITNYRVSNIMPDEDAFSMRVVSDEKPVENAVSAVPNLDDVCLYLFGEI